MKQKYYQAYNERYKTVHKKGLSWSSDICTPIVLETIRKLNISKEDQLLEIGCGEGRDAKAVLEQGYNLLATDISLEAINYCKAIMPSYSDRFALLDCLDNKSANKYRFIYAVAVIHMLVLDEDRQKFYEFIYHHLEKDGYALICSMGDGKAEIKTDINEAFSLKKREHHSGEIEVASTSLRMVSFELFEKEISDAGLHIIDKGITSSLPDFDMLMFAVVKKDR